MEETLNRKLLEAKYNGSRAIKFIMEEGRGSFADDRRGKIVSRIKAISDL